MKYLLMVGHGQFPPGLHNALTMFASDTPDLMYCNVIKLRKTEIKDKF